MSVRGGHEGGELGGEPEGSARGAAQSSAPRGVARVARAGARVLAQAKINLFLRVLAREESGFHQLETLFQRLALGDDVHVRVGVRGRTLDCRGADVGPVERNLAWRAALAYAEATGWPDGFAIEIDKRIAVGGGLGGGSADAGAVLRCLNALAPAPLDGAGLLALAGTLGADVPFLTAEAPLALAWGRGDRMLALPALPARRAHLAVFREGVSTAEAFARLAAARAAGGERPRPIVWSLERFARWDDVALVASNDFERVVLPERDDVAEVRGMFGTVARMLGELEDREEGGDVDGGEDDGADGGADGDSPSDDVDASHARTWDAHDPDADAEGRRDRFGAADRGSARADAPDDRTVDDRVDDELEEEEALNALDGADGDDGADTGRADGDTLPVILMTGSGATVYLLTPMAGVGVSFDVQAADASVSDDDPPVTIVQTATATRVASVLRDG